MTKHYLTSAQQIAGKYTECMATVCGLYPVCSGYAAGLLPDYTGEQYIPGALSVHYQCITRALNTRYGYSIPELDNWASTGSIAFSKDRAGRFILSSIKSIQMAKTKVVTTITKGISADRIKNDPLFERTRENASEFGRAGKAAKFTRVIFRELLIYAKDTITQARLVQLFSRIIATDPVGERGERTVANGEIEQLLNFNFNARAGFRDVFYKKFKVAYDRVTGLVQVELPAYIPKMMVAAAKGTNTFNLVMGAATVDFNTEDYEFASFSTPEIPWDQNQVAASTLSVNLPANSKQTVVVVLGIEYFSKLRNGKSYPLKTGEYNAATIVLLNPAP